MRVLLLFSRGKGQDSTDLMTLQLGIGEQRQEDELGANIVIVIHLSLLKKASVCGRVNREGDGAAVGGQCRRRILGQAGNQAGRSQHEGTLTCTIN